jgi:hypothetical protein
VSILAVTANAAGNLPVESVDEAVDRIENMPESIKPKHPGPGTHLKRGMATMTKGDNEREVKTNGRKSNAVYTILATDMGRLDREVDDGKGVSNAEVSARIIWDDPQQPDNYSIKIDPPHHPAAPYIRQKQRESSGQYSATYDLKVWFTSRFLPYLGAFKSPDAQGKYLLPKGDQEAVQLLLDVQEAFRDLTSGGKLRIYIDGIVRDDADKIDLIADCMQDHEEKMVKVMEKELDDFDGGKRFGKRRMATMADEAHKLRENLQRMAEACTAAQQSSYEGIAAIETRLGLCELALDD